jgi:hypothetical protein
MSTLGHITINRAVAASNLMDLPMPSGITATVNGGGRGSN